MTLYATEKKKSHYKLIKQENRREEVKFKHKKTVVVTFPVLTTAGKDHSVREGLYHLLHKKV